MERIYKHRIEIDGMVTMGVETVGRGNSAVNCRNNALQSLAAKLRRENPTARIGVSSRGARGRMSVESFFPGK